jgi:hypothetical protein
MIDQRAVYVFKPPGEKDFTGIALDVHIHKEALRFFDTNRGHELPGKVTHETDNGFTFTSTGITQGEWQFKVLGIGEFKRKYYKLVEGGQTLAAKLKTTEDLHQWYRREFKI